jgi:hypothetical protein
MTARRLALEMHRLLDFNPQRLNLDLNGASNTALRVESLIGARHQNRREQRKRAKRVREVHP